MRRPVIWDRGDVCSYDGHIYVVLTPSGRSPVVLEALDDGQRVLADAADLRRAQKRQLVAVQRRLEKRAAQIASQRAHIDLELKRRVR